MDLYELHVPIGQAQICQNSNVITRSIIRPDKHPISSHAFLIIRSSKPKLLIPYIYK